MLGKKQTWRLQEAFKDYKYRVEALIKCIIRRSTISHLEYSPFKMIVTNVSAGADTLLGPEMKSTGEVMGIDRDFSSAYAKASIAAGLRLPTSGNIFITMIDKFKDQIVPVGKQLQVTSFYQISWRCRRVTYVSCHLSSVEMVHLQPFRDSLSN